MDEDEVVIIVCQGPPRCDLMGQEAVDAQNAGCPWCQRIYLDGMGGERIEQPWNA